MKISKIVLDEEFRAIVFRPNEEQYTGLKEDIAKDGIEEPLTVDQEGRLLDGYTRLQIAQELGLLDVPTKLRRFGDRQEAMRFILRMAIKRRNLNTAQLCELSYRLLNFEQGEARRRQQEHGNTAPGRHKSLMQQVAEVSGKALYTGGPRRLVCGDSCTETRTRRSVHGDPYIVVLIERERGFATGKATGEKRTRNR